MLFEFSTFLESMRLMKSRWQIDKNIIILHLKDYQVRIGPVNEGKEFRFKLYKIEEGIPAFFSYTTHIGSEVYSYLESFYLDICAQLLPKELLKELKLYKEGEE